MIANVGSRLVVILNGVFVCVFAESQQSNENSKAKDNRSRKNSKKTRLVEFKERISTRVQRSVLTNVFFFSCL